MTEEVLTDPLDHKPFKQVVRSTLAAEKNEKLSECGPESYIYTIYVYICIYFIYLYTYTDSIVIYLYILVCNAICSYVHI